MIERRTWMIRKGRKMAFLLDDVVPWGRTLSEYQKMFSLSDEDMKLKIASFGDGPASFNSEVVRAGSSVTSYDMIYQFSREDIARRIEEVRKTVIRQMEQNMENYNWDWIKNLSDLERIRMDAMQLFLADYEKGKQEGRYIYHVLPERVELPEQSYDLGLSSHFLLMYENLGYDFHIRAITEMLRLCREVRIFPVCDLDGKSTKLAEDVITYFKKTREAEVVSSDYQFQKSTNEMLIIR